MGYGNYPDLNGVKKILVIKLRHLGDVLLTGPVFSALKQAMPWASIDAYIYQEAAAMLEGHPAIDQILYCERKWKRYPFVKRFVKEMGFLRQLRRKGYDLVVNLTEGDRGVVAAKISGASIRVGMKPKGAWQQSWLTHIAKDCHSIRHTVEKNLDVIRRIGVFPKMEERELHFLIPEEVRLAVQQRVGNEPFVLLHPTSRWKFKCWPIQKMRSLAQLLLEDGKRVVLTAGPDPVEMEMAEEIASGLDILNLAGQISLKELGALIDAAQMVVCVDSVPFHLTSALKKPVVAIFGPTSDQTWGPWRNPYAKVVALPWSCRPCYLDGCGGSKKSDCLESLPVETVWQAVRSCLISKTTARLHKLQSI